jgi:hypothetical protein
MCMLQRAGTFTDFLSDRGDCSIFAATAPNTSYSPSMRLPQSMSQPTLSVHSADPMSIVRARELPMARKLDCFWCRCSHLRDAVSLAFGTSRGFATSSACRHGLMLSQTLKPHGPRMCST